MKKALTSGSARTRTPTRLSEGCTRTTAHTIAVMPAATNARPRTVSPESASRIASASSGRLGAGRYRHAGHDRVQDRAGGAAAHRRFDARQQPVGEHRTGQPVHVVGEHVVAALH